MQKTTRAWLKVAALAPVFAGGLLFACGDSDDPPPPASGTGGTTTTPTATGGTTGSTGTPDAAATETPPAAPTAIEVNADIAADTTWSGGTYLLKKKIYVTNNAKLTIAAGTKVLGDATATDKAALLITRGAQLLANGTKAAPIVFTSSAAAGAQKGGDWAGVALLGSAKINTGAPCATAEAGCLEAGIEGIPASELRAKFGGTADTSSCGELTYVRVEFAGAELEPMKELNGLTFGGCGSGTKVSYVQVHRGTDDGIEVFGGTVGMDHVLLSGNEDDSLDWDYGWSGKVQFLVIHQRAGIGDNGIEAAGSPTSETALPRAEPLLYNVTMIGRAGTSGRAATFKEGTHGKIYNAIIQGFKGDVIDFQAKVVDLTMEWPMFLTLENSLFWENGAYTDESMPNAMGVSQDDDKMFNDKGAVEAPERKNKLDVNPGLAPGDLSTAAVPVYVPTNAAVGGQATPAGVGDVTATYAGAFAPGAPAWTDGWTAFPIPAP